MDDRYYVATDPRGIERFGDIEVHWPLPDDASSTPAEAFVRTDGAPLTLRRPIALLDVLDEVICLAEPADAVAPPPPGADGLVRVRSARLARRVDWDVTTAAGFALDCAEHVLGSAGDVELPGGHRLDETLAHARRFVEHADTTAEAHLGLLARLATARRLRRDSRTVGDIVFGLSMEDVARDLDTTLDPAWTTAASVADALLAALEAVRQLALPRYVRAREEAAETQGARTEPRAAPVVIPTPWGPIAFGAEHESPYMPASIAAREAALRARETAREREGGEAAERRWQAERLAALLGEPTT